MKLAGALLLGMLMVSASLAAVDAGSWCRQERKKCKSGCPAGAKIKFDCDDQDGARSVSCACVSPEEFARGQASSSSFSSSSSSSSSSGNEGATAKRASSHASAGNGDWEKEEGWWPFGGFPFGGFARFP